MYTQIYFLLLLEHTNSFKHVATYVLAVCDNVRTQILDKTL